MEISVSRLPGEEVEEKATARLEWQNIEINREGERECESVRIRIGRSAADENAVDNRSEPLNLDIHRWSFDRRTIPDTIDRRLDRPIVC